VALISPSLHHQKDSISPPYLSYLSPAESHLSVDILFGCLNLCCQTQVIYSQETHAAAEAAKAQGKSLWRVSSTVFGHVASHQTLRPLGSHFPRLPAAARYPPITAGNYVEQELSVIALKKPAEPVLA